MSLSESFTGRIIHLIGAKGTGMCAMAEILVRGGAQVSGSDTEEVFYTDRILDELNVPVTPFDRTVLNRRTSLVIRSAAYDDSNSVMNQALQNNIPIMTYPEALGTLSAGFDSSAVAGVHGKTTTTAMTGTILKALESASTVVAGSAVAEFGHRSTWSGGTRFLVAETCEYRRHFLHFRPRRIVLTSVESDHQDYYPDYSSILDAFCEFTALLPDGGTLIYCADDSGAAEAARRTAAKRPDIKMIPYGFDAEGPWRIQEAGHGRFELTETGAALSLKLPGRHMLLDAAAAMALSCAICTEEFASFDFQKAAQALASFTGSRRRSEIIGEANRILVMDDYAHHPTAIAAMLNGLRDFYPGRRIVVDFMPHTFSRTAALFDEFSRCFSDADELYLHPVYASARETNTSGITGRDLWKQTALNRPEGSTHFCETLDEAAEKITKTLRPGDLFLTMGAGNNQPLGPRILKEVSL